MNYRQIPLIIPSLDPDERLISLLDSLKKEQIENIVLVNDGSSSQYDRFYQYAEEQGCTVLVHAVNLGKGRALKDAFNYCLLTWPDAPGCVTADSDGQHTTACILKCMEALASHPDDLILGCRDFNDPSVPEKSKFGNKLTSFMFSAFIELPVSDTQTGLRGIGRNYMETLLSISGERFEFETNMLIATKKNNVALREVTIQTVYDSKENHATHFNPIKDSIRIYRLFGRAWLYAFILFAVELLLFAGFYAKLNGTLGILLAYFASCTIAANCRNTFWKFDHKTDKLCFKIPFFYLIRLILGIVFTIGMARLLLCTPVVCKAFVDLVLSVIISLVRFKSQKTMTV